MKELLTIILLGLTIQSLAINPTREYTRTPEMFGIKYSQYKIKTSDNYDINVWDYSVLDNVVPSKTIILVGPDAGNMGFLIWQAKMLRDKGIRVIAFDYRGFGQSSDFDIVKENLYHSEFSIDLDSVIKSTREKYPTEKVGLYAMSMGTHISLLRKQKIDFFVAEGFFHDPKLVTERIKTTKGKIVTLPADSTKVRKMKPSVPILIFCTTDDKTTITADAIDFKKGNNVTIVELKGDHLTGINILTKDSPGDKYAERIVDFLVKNNL
jgi:alpha-beta hydrolase superfamily lysophospholipase